MRKLTNIIVNNILIIIFTLFCLISFFTFMLDREVPLSIEQSVYKRPITPSRTKFLDEITEDGIITWKDWIRSCMN